MGLYLHSFSRWCLPDLRKQAEFPETSDLLQFKVIQSHWSWCHSKAHMQLPFSVYWLIKLENGLFSPAHALFDATTQTQTQTSKFWVKVEKTRGMGLPVVKISWSELQPFLADRTNCRSYTTVFRPSVCQLSNVVCRRLRRMYCG